MPLISLSLDRKPDDDCLKCGLFKTCQTPIMNFSGPEDAIWKFVGEAPGGDEDDPKNAEAFVGKAGRFLKKVIRDSGIPLDKCSFSNSVRCRPPGNDLAPYPKAWQYCQPKILREIHVTKPKVVVVLGAVALKSVLGKMGITKLHGETFQDDEHNRVYLACLHPSYILRNPTEVVIRKFITAIQLAARLGGVRTKHSKSESVQKTKTVVITDKKQLQECTDWLRSRKRLATDIEGATLSAFHPNAALGCVGFCPEPPYAIVYPIFARVGWEKKIKIKPEEMLEAVKDIWTDSDIEHSLHFGKYDEGYVYQLHGFRIKNYRHDTGIASYAYDITKGVHGLKDWELRLGGDAYWDRKKREWLRDHVEANPESGGDHNCIPGDILYPYNGEDCVYTFKLEDYLIPILKEMGRYEKPFLFPMMECHNPMAEYLEIAGLNLDMDKNEHLLEEFPKRMEQLEKKLRSFPEYHQLVKLRKRELMGDLHERVISYKKQVPDIQKKTISLYTQAIERMKEKGDEFVNFTDADKRILIYDLMGMPIDDEERTPTGMPTVKTEILEKFKKKPPGLTLILRRSEYFSANSKYVEPIRFWRGTDGRTHTSYLIHGQNTGRVSSEKPNHENLMKRGDQWIVENVRSQFVPTDDGYILCKADLKQNELRLLADRSKDKVMTKEFNDGKDPHRMAASAGYGIPEDEVTDDQRTKAKQAVSFGLVYGRHARALSQDLGWSLSKGERFIADYFGKYYGIREYLDNEGDRLRKVRFSISYFGRVCPLDRGLDSEKQGMVERAVRQGINAPIQGDSSDIAWVAGYRLMMWLRKHRMKTKVVIIEHDALYLDLFRKEAADVFPKLLHFMTDREWLKKKTGHWFTVPFDIDVAGGFNLSEHLQFERSGDTFLLPKELR